MYISSQKKKKNVINPFGGREKNTVKGGGGSSGTGALGLVHISL